MDFKRFVLMILAIIGLFLLLGMANTVYGANVDVVSDFNNNTLTTVEMSDSQSKTIWGFENLAEVQTKTGGDMQNTHIETDEGLWNYEYMILNSQIMDRNDRVYGKNGNQTLYAHYSLTPYGYADITVIDDVGNSGGYVNYPVMKNIGDSVTHTFKPFTDYDDIHWEPFFIQDMDTKQVYQPDDNFTITYSDCIANNGTIHKVFKYIYGYYPDYNANFISINKQTGEIFDNVTITINRQNWSAFYTLPEAPEIAGKVLDYIRIVEDDVYNYKPGNTYEAMYDMCLSEGNNLTRSFEYNYKEGAYANVTVNYIINATGSEYDRLVFNTISYPYLVVGEELIGGYVLDYPTISDFEFVSVTYSEEIVNGVKAMVDGSDVTDIGGFWFYEITETGDISLNFLYNYVPIKVEPTPEPTPTPASGNESIDNNSNETEPVIPTPIVPVDNKVINNNTNSTNMNNITTEAVLNDSGIVTIPVTGKNPCIAVAVVIIFILLFVIGYYIDNRRNED